MELKIIYSNRKTLCLKVEQDGSVTVRSPRGISRQEIDSFAKRHASWIEKRKAEALRRRQAQQELDSAALMRLKNEAKAYIPARVEYYAGIMGVRPTGIRITAAKTRFGSCSERDSLCFSLYLMCYSKEAVDAVIVHELAHIRHKNHSREFYDEVEKVLPDYKERKKLLKNGIL